MNTLTEYKLSPETIAYLSKPIDLILFELDRVKKPVIYRHKKRKRIELLRAGKLESALMVPIGNSQIRLFKQLEPELNDFMYWKLLRVAWQHSKATIGDLNKWLRLFNSPRTRRESMAELWEQDAFDSLPKTLRVWRGCGHPIAARGLSWSLDSDRASEHADHACGTHYEMKNLRLPEIPTVVSGTVRKADVIAFFGRYPAVDEIVVDPNHVEIEHIDEIYLPPRRII